MNSNPKPRFYSDWSRTDWVHFFWWSAVVIIVLGLFSLIGTIITNDSNNDYKNNELEAEAHERCMALEGQKAQDHCIDAFRKVGDLEDITITVE